MIALGLGFSKDATCHDILAAVAEISASGPGAARKLDILATADFKAESDELVKAASELGVSVTYLDQPALAGVADRLSTMSAASLGRTGVGSLCEAAALAAAGRNAILLVTRRIHGRVTCAIASGDGR